MTYVALLRGINVGGNNRIKMAELKQTFEKSGFAKVKTFIASGNVIFSTDETNHTELTKKIELAIREDFGISIAVLLRDFNSIDKLVKAIPSSWVNDKEIKCDVMFLWDEIDNKRILTVLPFDSMLEEVRYVPGAVLWRIDRHKASKSRMFKIVGTKLYKKITIRNPNTVRKLYQLMVET
ncbi:MAG TPA: DUF1697 domain-containing protein [Candidatus Sulfotelmatobacter sp.]|jgi:uncharacterized protein (DUF1697 family)|nr:DUF1697 domain-containing protein [Candidatus Sulfotelmatobacter sp.]